MTRAVEGKTHVRDQGDRRVLTSVSVQAITVTVKKKNEHVFIKKYERAKNAT